jgi:hypothetical protein
MDSIEDMWLCTHESKMKIFAQPILLHNFKPIHDGREIFHMLQLGAGSSSAKAEVQTKASS